MKFVTIRHEQTGEFTRHLWNHYKEYVQVCIVPDKLILLKGHSDYIEKICYDIYPPNDEYELWGVEVKPGTMLNDDDISQEIVFENIRSQIIDEIRKSLVMRKLG